MFQKPKILSNFSSLAEGTSCLSSAISNTRRGKRNPVENVGQVSLGSPKAPTAVSSSLWQADALTSPQARDGALKNELKNKTDCSHVCMCLDHHPEPVLIKHSAIQMSLVCVQKPAELLLVLSFWMQLRAICSGALIAPCVGSCGRRGRSPALLWWCTEALCDLC